MRHSSLTLEILEHFVLCGVPLVVGGLFMPYGTTMGRALRDSERLAAQCSHDFSSHSRRTVSSTLHRLHKQGFVRHRGPRSAAAWHITQRGKRHFVSKKMTAGPSLPPDDGKVRLVVFDIPEEMRGQRDWLRIRLRSCKYSFFQKSVWVGTRPLPDILLHEFKDRGIAEHVHAVGLEEMLKRVV